MAQPVPQLRVDLLTRAVPAVDVLVNTLGIFEPKPFVEITDADWHRFFDINVMSGVRLSRAYMKGMLARNWGRIIFISSESALNIPTEMIHYGTTKTAQLAISRGLAKLTRGTGVTVNSVLPGPTMSEGVETFVKDLARQGGDRDLHVRHGATRDDHLQRQQPRAEHAHLQHQAREHGRGAVPERTAAAGGAHLGDEDAEGREVSDLLHDPCRHVQDLHSHLTAR